MALRNINIQPTLTERPGSKPKTESTKLTYGETVDTATLIPHMLEAAWRG